LDWRISRRTIFGARLRALMTAAGVPRLHVEKVLTTPSMMSRKSMTAMTMPRKKRAALESVG